MIKYFLCCLHVCKGPYVRTLTCTDTSEPWIRVLLLGQALLSMRSCRIFGNARLLAPSKLSIPRNNNRLATSHELSTYSRASELRHALSERRAFIGVFSAILGSQPIYYLGS